MSINKKLFCLASIVMLGVGCCFAQTNQLPKLQIWGNNVNGVRLAIYSTNNSLSVDSKENLFAEITNGSTNSITLWITDLRINDFSILLTDASNNVHTVVQPSGAVYVVFPPTIIHPNENQCWWIPFKIGTEINAGNFTLTATRNFGMGAFSFDPAQNKLVSSPASYHLESNPVKVHVKSDPVYDGFQQLYVAWHVEIKTLGDYSGTPLLTTNLPSFKKIEAMGRSALPYLLKKLEEGNREDCVLAFAAIDICGLDRRDFMGLHGIGEVRMKVMAILINDEAQNH